MRINQPQFNTIHMQFAICCWMQKYKITNIIFQCLRFIFAHFLLFAVADYI